MKKTKLLLTKEELITDYLKFCKAIESAFVGKLNSWIEDNTLHFSICIKIEGHEAIWTLPIGQEYFKEEYPELYNVLKETMEDFQETETTFRLPDMRGRFVRGFDITTLKDEE